MKQKENFVFSILSHITYKKKKKPKEFYIPEVNESESDTNGREKGAGNNLVPNHQDQGLKKDNKGMKKPIPVSELKKEQHQTVAKPDENSFPIDIQSNIDFINKKFNAPTNKDIVIRKFTIGGKHKAFLAFIDGMADKVTINNFILRPLLKDVDFKNLDEECHLDYIVENVLEINRITKIDVPDEVVCQILTGSTALYIDGCNYYILCETKGFEKRAVEKPQTEGVVRGAQEAFNENLRTNVTLIRRIIKNNDLTTEYMKIGDKNNIQCAIMYINGLINPAIVKEVKRRISSIKSDFVTGDGMLEQFIEDTPFSLIPTVLNTERPDRTASHIVEGKAAILADGVPFSLIVPSTIHAQIHSPEDVGLKWQHASTLRIVRWLAIVIAILLPGLYVALTNFHREMIPTDLLVAIAQAKENVPFPTVVEILLMELAFELIREAGIRIPGIIGNTLGIIGALILGQAAVEANIVSPILIIVIAVTGLGNFAIPNFSLAFGIRIIRFAFIFLGASLGFYGIALGMVATVVIVSNMKSFGIPILIPVGPKAKRSFDLFLKWPVWKQELRQDALNPLDVRRQPEISRGWTKQEPEDSYDKEEQDD
jgi:spore germination protein KA